MTLATSALKVAKFLSRTNAAGTAIIDLETEIKDEIAETIRYYNRKPFALNEFRQMELDTVASTTWYSSVDLTSGDGDQDNTGRTAVDVNDILKIHYMRENPGGSGQNEPMTYLPYQQFEANFEGSQPTGTPTYYTRYAGQIGIWPTPDAAYTLYLSGLVKAVIPSDDSDTSAWLDQCEEMVLAGATARVALKYLRNTDLAGQHAAIEKTALEGMEREYILKSSSGKLRVHY